MSCDRGFGGEKGKKIESFKNLISPPLSKRFGLPLLFVCLFVCPYVHSNHTNPGTGQWINTFYRGGLAHQLTKTFYTWVCGLTNKR